MKKYNDLKQRLVEIGMKNLLFYYLIIYICLKVFEKLDWNIFFNNIIRYGVYLPLVISESELLELQTRFYKSLEISKKCF